MGAGVDAGATRAVRRSARWAGALCGTVLAPRQDTSATEEPDRSPLTCISPSSAFRHPQVINAKVPYLASWNASKTLLGACQDLKAQIVRAPRQQPPDGANY